MVRADIEKAANWQPFLRLDINQQAQLI